MLPPRVMLPQRNTLLLRLIVIILLVIAFLWMSFEDADTTFVMLLSVNLALSGVLLWAFRRYGGVALVPRAFLMGAALLGAVTGASVSLIAVALMFFKNAWHSHLFPDFPLPMLGDMAARAFVWAGSGALFGIAVALLALAAATARYTQSGGDGASTVPDITQD